VLRSRWIVFLPVALFALFAPAKAEASQTGLLVRGYQITEIPPTKSDLAYPLCGTSVEPFINATWDYEQNLFGECGWDSFMLHYTGFLQIPEHETIEFWIASDDGGTVKIGTEEFGVWQDQGCSATETGLMNIAAGTQNLDAWFYENGGGTCFMLAWNIDDTGWAIIQPEFFTSEPLVPETTSVLEMTTTEPSTTTMEMPVSTTAASIYQPSTTELGTTTTSVIPSTTIFQPTTTAVPQTTTALPQTTSSVIPLPIPQPVAEVVATTSVPATTTIPEPLPETMLTTSPQTSEPVSPATTAPMIPLDTSTSLPKPSETSTSVEVTPPTFFSPDEPLTTEQFVSVLAVLSESTPDEVAEIVTTILASDLSSDQAEQLVASAEILTAITGEQAQQLFDEIEPTQLSESMAAVIADALNDPEVPDEVREAFEESINIFSNDGFSTYVPTGSAVNVSVRRTIIAGTTILMALPSPVSTRRP
jgi:uncharacterized protein (UPF0147 family)